MDSSILVPLANLGGGFLVAGLLLLLHRDALKAFREELKEEREANARLVASERALFEERHQKMVSMAVKFHESQMDEIRKVHDDVKDTQRYLRNGVLQSHKPERGSECPAS